MVCNYRQAQPPDAGSYFGFKKHPLKILIPPSIKLSTVTELASTEQVNISTLSSSKLFFFEVQLQLFSLIINVEMKEMHKFSILLSRQISGFIANSSKPSRPNHKKRNEVFVDEI
jgi:hypothetical protein